MVLTVVTVVTVGNRSLSADEGLEELFDDFDYSLVIHGPSQDRQTGRGKEGTLRYENFIFFNLVFIQYRPFYY